MLSLARSAVAENSIHGGWTSAAIIDLGSFGGETDSYSINDFGQVAGHSFVAPSSPVAHAFVWSPEAPNSLVGSLAALGDLAVPGQSIYGSEALAINSIGQVAGHTSGSWHATVWQPLAPNAAASTPVSLPLLEPDDFRGQSAAYAINEVGQAAGTSSVNAPDVSSYHAVLWQPTAPNSTAFTAHDLVGLDPQQPSWALGMNRYGQVVGYGGTSDSPPKTRAFLWTPNEANGTVGTIVDLGSLDDAPISMAYDINDFGQVVGWSGDGAGHSVAYLWTPDRVHGTTGTMTGLRSLGGASGSAVAINDAGVVAGGLQLGDGSYSPFVWKPDSPNGSHGAMVDLQTMLPNDSPWNLQSATGLNNRGQITGVGQVNGAWSSFLLSIPSLAPLTAQIGDVSVAEGTSLKNRTISVPVSMSAPLPHSLCIWYSTIDGTATGSTGFTSASSDFLARGDPTPLFKYLPAGRTNTSLSTAVRSDGAAEPDETFTVRISHMSAAVGSTCDATSPPDPTVTLTRSHGNVTILNDDPETFLHATTVVPNPDGGYGMGPMAVTYFAGSVWTTDLGEGVVKKINPETNIVVATTSVGIQPWDVAGAFGTVWSANQGSGTVSRVDPATGGVLATINGFSAPTVLAADDTRMWVTNEGSARVSAIDPVTNSLGASVQLAPGLSGMAWDGEALWVGNLDKNLVYRVDTTANLLTATIPIADGPQWFVPDAAGVWVTSLYGHRVSHIDRMSNAVDRVIDTGNFPYRPAIDSSTMWVPLAAEFGRTVEEIDLASGAIVDRIETGYQPVHVAIAGATVWVANYTGKSVSRIDRQRNLDVGDVITGEGSGSSTRAVVVPVSVSRSVPRPQCVWYRLIPATASSVARPTTPDGTQDFLDPRMGALTYTVLRPGVMLKHIAIKLRPDAVLENDETFSVAVEHVTDLTGGRCMSSRAADPTVSVRKSVGIVSIVNDDSLVLP